MTNSLLNQGKNISKDANTQSQRIPANCARIETPISLRDFFSTNRWRRNERANKRVNPSTKNKATKKSTFLGLA